MSARRVLAFNSEVACLALVVQACAVPPSPSQRMQGTHGAAPWSDSQHASSPSVESGAAPFPASATASAAPTESASATHGKPCGALECELFGSAEEALPKVLAGHPR